VWALVRAEVGDGVLDADRARCAEVLRRREDASWPDAIAGQMERHYSPGRTWESLARGFLGLVRAGDVLDVGSGDGTVAELLVPRCRSLTLLDRSEKLLAAARRRLAPRPVRTERGDMHELPFDDASFDHVLMLNVLQFSHAPARALAEAARVLRPAGELTAVTLARHAHSGVTETYGHVNAGFDPGELASTLRGAGLDPSLCDVTSRERRAPHFQIVTALATKGPR
jgi:ArsR family transcriptional regulator